MANGFPSGNFRIVNKKSGACIASQHGGYTHGLQDAVTALGEKGVLPYTHTNDRLLTVHDKVKNIEEELWYFDSSTDAYGRRKNMLYNKVVDIRSTWVLGASVDATVIDYKWQDQDLENFLSLLPIQNEETLTHLRASNYLDITQLLKTFLRINDEEKIKSELVGKQDDKNFDDSLNTALAYDLVENIMKKFQEYISAPFLDLDGPEVEGFPQPKKQLYKIIIASIKLDFLNEQYYDNRELRSFELDLEEYRDFNTNTHLKNFKTEKFVELQDTVWAEHANIEDPKKEAVKIILDLTKDLHHLTEDLVLGIDKKDIDLAKIILQTSLKSNETFEQLQTALNSTNGKELKPVNWHSGNVFLQGAGRQYQTKWAFEDGYIFVEGQPDAVLTHSSSSSVRLSHRSDNPYQRWELKSA